MWNLQLGMYNVLCRDDRGTCVFTCNGCREVARLRGKIEGLTQMMESMKTMVTGQGLEEQV